MKGASVKNQFFLFFVSYPKLYVFVNVYHSLRLPSFYTYVEEELSVDIVSLFTAVLPGDVRLRGARHG